MNKEYENKIAIFSPFLNPVGVKRATFGLSKKFSENGYDINLLSVHKEWDNLKLNKNMKLIRLSTNFKNFPTTGYLAFRITSLIISLRTIFTLSRYIKANKPKILFVSMMPFVAWLAIKLSRKNIKLVISIQGYPRNNLFRRITWKKVFGDADKVITESKSLMKLIHQLTNAEENLKYIYNPHFENQDEFRAIRESVKESNNYILGLGRLTKQKNFKLLIHAFEKLKNRDDLKLIIVGDGEEKKSLEKISNDLGLKSKIIFTGQLKNPLNYIKNAKMLIIPSLWEGLPRVAIEAQALKTPIISSCNEGGLGEILINGEAGQLVLKNDINDLAKAINRYLDDEKLASSHAEEAFKNINRFSLESSSNEYLKVFSEI